MVLVVSSCIRLSKASNFQVLPRISTRRIHRGRVTIGIRREDPLRIWERRCPLTPEAVNTLIREDNVDVLVQPCERRVFTGEQFTLAGAKVHDTLSPAHIILGIKETPLNELLLDPVVDDYLNQAFPRTHIMFSHTIKGQAYNMPLLSQFLHDPDSNTRNDVSAGTLPTLIDWELLTDSHGKRTVGFGWYAGVAGALEGLISTAHLHLELGVASPFLGTPRPHSAPLSELRTAMRRIGQSISLEGTPQSMGPYIICVSGSGQVAQGALSLLSELPVQMVTVSELPSLVEDPTTPLNKVYVLHASQEVYLVRKDGGVVSRSDYYKYPTAYESRFHKIIAPYMTLLINGVGWTQGYPRLLSNNQTVSALEQVEQLRNELAKDGAQSSSTQDVMKGRCQSYADISCDINGGLEFMPRISTLSQPFFYFKPPQFPSYLPGIQIMSVDILPTSLPLDASQAFCTGVLPYIRSLIHKYQQASKISSSRDDIEHLEALERATVARSGSLVGKNAWLQSLVYGSHLSAGHDLTKTPAPEKSAKSTFRDPHKKILLFGSGLVSGPVVDEICKRQDVHLIIASDQVHRNKQLCSMYTNASTVTVDMRKTETVEDLIKTSDVVISLLPVPFHPSVAELCLKHRKHLVTASYISPEMQSLHDRAAQAGIILLNEIGLDPGVDHCSALSLLDSLRQQKKNIVSFTSFCGGLPAPEDSNVPLRYKFSWSPRGVLSAALNDAKFLLDGKERRVPGAELLQSSISQLPVSNVLRLEGIPNRNSLSYADTYNLETSNGLQTLFRGTIRYPGFCGLLYAFRQIGLLETSTWVSLRSWETLAQQSLAAKLQISLKDPASFESACADVVPRNLLSELQEALEWLHSSSSSTGLPSPPSTPEHPIDLLALLLSHRLSYAPGERDLVLLHHEVITAGANGDRVEVHSSSLEVYGNSQHSAMARCVGLPVAFSALRILDGDIPDTGVHGPTHPHFYAHVLDRLDSAGLTMSHSVRKYSPGLGVEARLREVWE